MTDEAKREDQAMEAPKGPASLEEALELLYKQDLESAGGSDEGTDPEPTDPQPEPEGEPGDPGDDPGTDGATPAIDDLPDDQAGDQGASSGDDEIEPAEVADIQKEARDFAIKYVRDAFEKQGVPKTPDGALGWTPDNKDICKVDADGIKRYYNPDNGREFTGPNPRKDAQEYCDQRNRELAEAFNKSCAKVEAQRLDESKPTIEMLKFEKTYDSMDETTRDLFDDLIEDYEIKDKHGDVIGYSCDLKKAHAAAKRQAARVSKWREAVPEKQATGPETDMKKGNAKADPKPKKQVDSLAAAMEALEDAKIEKGRK